MTTAAFVAAHRKRIRLVLAVMVLPHRPAVLMAKMLSTILVPGSTADIVKDFKALRALGVAAVDIDFERSQAEASIARKAQVPGAVIARL